MEASKLSYIEINKLNLENNIFEIKKNLNENVCFAPVIKSNAYGHGFLEILKILVNNNIKTICVAFIEEALRVRKIYPDIRIICLGYIALCDIKEAVDKRIEFIVFNSETIKKASKCAEKLNKKALLHLKLETGTNRQGILSKDLDDIILLLKKLPNILIAGISTHYANIEDTTDHYYAKDQLKKFVEMSGIIKRSLNIDPKLHTACSAAAILFPETYFNLVRVGISLYGFWPSKETYLSSKLLNKNIILKPVLSWKTIVSQIKTIPAGSYVGYGCTYKTTTKTKLAYLPIGYFDGYDRLLSNRGWVLINGKRAPVRGRVCMNVVIVDVTNIDDVSLEDEVVLIGEQRNEIITADTIAELCNTINYEIVTRINPLIKRKIIEKKK